jgi:hypothetical protein
MDKFFAHQTKRPIVMIVQIVVVLSFWFITFLAMFIPTYALARYILSTFN